MNVDERSVCKGETIDFVVGGHDNFYHDDFLWAPIIRGEPNPVPGAGHDGRKVQEWNSLKDFAGPSVRPLKKWEQVAQVLLMSNELMFVD